MLAAGLLCGVFMTANNAFAWDYAWPFTSTSRSLAVSHVSVDAYLPWNSGGSAKAMGMGGAFTAVADDLGGAVEYNPAGLSYLEHVNVGALAIANRATSLSATGAKTSKWTFTPTYAGGALKIGPLAVAVSRKQPQENPGAYLKLSRAGWWGIVAPDGFPMNYDTVSDKMDTSGLKTYVLTAAIKLGRLSLGANYNSIKGDITRVQSGGISAQQATWYTTGQSNRFYTSEKVQFNGYTMDAGALLDMGILRLGASAKNFKGSVDVTRNSYWSDNFVWGSGSGPQNNWTWTSPTTKENMTEFAPTYSAGAALLLGKLVTVDMDYVTATLQDSTKAMGRLGAQVAVIPGFLFARGGVKSDFKNLVQGQNNKTNEYFLGAGLKLAVLTVDASASLVQAKAGNAGGDMTGSVSAMLKF